MCVCAAAATLLCNMTNSILVVDIPFPPFCLSFDLDEQHHDYIEYHLERAIGVRIVTVFMYLNDVDEGGGTHFPFLNVVRNSP